MKLGAVTKKVSLRSKKLKAFILGALSLTIIIAVIGGLLIWRNNEISGMKCGGDDTDKLYKEIATAANSNDIRPLYHLVSDIRKQDGYQQDRNCLYAIISYYQKREDADNLKKYEAILKDNNRLNDSFSKPISDDVATVGDLTRRLEAFYLYLKDPVLGGIIAHPSVEPRKIDDE